MRSNNRSRPTSKISHQILADTLRHIPMKRLYATASKHPLLFTPPPIPNVNSFDLWHTDPAPAHEEDDPIYAHPNHQPISEYHQHYGQLSLSICWCSELYPSTACGTRHINKCN